MRSSGGIGDQMVRISYENRELYIVRYLYDLFCFTALNLIGLNIIFGIVIDTFASNFLW